MFLQMVPGIGNGDLQFVCWARSNIVCEILGVHHPHNYAAWKILHLSCCKLISNIKINVQEEYCLIFPVSQ